MTLKNKAGMIIAAAATLCASAGARTHADQIPTEFKNLQVLPKTITRADLVQTMRQITGDLGVRCTYCHVGPDDLAGMDFATDEKATKRAARTMLKMVQAINADYVAAIPAGADARRPVTCVTCHRRAAKPPQPLAALMLETIGARGVQAALNEHRTLRDELLDSGLYDFRESTLRIVATRLRETGKLAEALEILKRNAELFPTSAGALAGVGDVAIQMKNVALAEKYYQKALAVDPAHQGALRGLEAIKK